MKRLRIPFALLCVASLAWAAGEPWEKEFKSWDKGDTEKVLQNSPWGKKVTTREEYEKSQDKSGGWGPQGRETSAEKLDRGIPTPKEFARAVWWSARTPRRAYMRLAELSGQPVTMDQIRQFAESPIENPVIALWESDMVMQLAMKMDPEQLKQAALLESSRLKKKIAPAEVTIVKTGAGRPDRIVFAFPKEVDGQPLATSADKVLRFKWKLPRTPKESMKDAKQFEAQFQPAKMVALGQADM
jgi:hypothetical protein